MLRRLRSESGFLLVELLIALMLLNIGLLSIVAAFSAGSTALVHASRKATAGALADQQMELYRGLTYSCIYLSAAGSTSNWTGDTTFNTGSMYTTACGTPPAAGSGADALDPKSASQTVTGPDHHRYEIDTYITTYTPTNGRAEKRVGVAVHDTLTAAVWAREQSTFDQSTGS